MASIELRKLRHDKIFQGNKNPTFDRVSIVGNSGMLKHQDHGDRIDDSDCVVRLNAAPVFGWEPHVGSKTSFRVINGLLQKGKTLGYTSTPKHWLKQVRDENLIWVPVSDRSEKIAKRLSHESNIIYHLTPKVKSWICVDVKSELRKFCSTGLFSVLVFSCLSDVVDVYGFGFHQEDISQRHYWEKWSSSHDSSHQWQQEQEIMVSWDQEYDFFNLI